MPIRENLSSCKSSNPVNPTLDQNCFSGSSMLNIAYLLDRVIQFWVVGWKSVVSEKFHSFHSKV